MKTLLNLLLGQDRLVKVKSVKRAVAKTGRKKMSKRTKVMNLLSKGQDVSWKVLRSRFDLVSPRALIDTLRAEGNMIYINRSNKGTSYRLGTPTRAIIAAGIKKLYGTPYAYNVA